MTRRVFSRPVIIEMISVLVVSRLMVSVFILDVEQVV